MRRINVSGNLSRGVYAKDVILHIIGLLGVKGGVGYGYEYGGDVIEQMTMEERMTVCNMAIEVELELVTSIQIRLHLII